MPIDIQVLQQLSANDSSLTRLDLREHHLTATDVHELVNALAGNTTLAWLDVSSNQLGDAEAIALAGIQTLTWLDISFNQIGDTGVSAFARHQRLSTLLVSYNQIGDLGAKAFEENQTLTKLDLNHNRIGDEGAASLTKIRNLTWLDIGYNEVGDRGANALMQHTKLTALNISMNPMSKAAIRLLKRQIEDNNQHTVSVPRPATWGKDIYFFQASSSTHNATGSSANSAVQPPSVNQNIP